MLGDGDWGCILWVRVVGWLGNLGGRGEVIRCWNEINVVFESWERESSKSVDRAAAEYGLSMVRFGELSPPAMTCSRLLLFSIRSSFMNLSISPLTLVSVYE